jgi:hypothetical protein
MRNRWYLLFAAGLMGAAMWGWVQKVAIPHQISESAARGIPRGNLSDLYPRWLGARELLLQGRNPYSPEMTREIQIGYYGRPLDPSHPNDPKDQQAFAYPVYVVFLLAPTIGWHFFIVRRMFFFILVLVTAISVRWWSTAVGWQLSPIAQWVWILLAIGCFPAIQGFKLQQLTLVVSALVAASMWAIASRRFAWAGVLLALASIKPQLVALLILWLCIWVAGDWRQRRNLLWSFAASMATLILAGEIALPGWIGEFRNASAAYYQYTGGGKSVLDVALTPLWGRIVSAILICLMMLLVWQRRRAGERTAAFQWMLALVLATTLLVIPMFAPYNQVLLIPSLMVVVRESRTLWTRSRLSEFLTALTAISVFWPWLASTALVIALPFLPSAVVQKAWAAPLYTTMAIPLTLFGLLLINPYPSRGLRERAERE